MHKPALALLLAISMTASLSCEDSEPFRGVWVFIEDGVERVAFGFGSVEVESAQRNAEGGLTEHWKGTHDLQYADDLFEGTITWNEFVDLDTDEWEEWDFVNEEDVRLALEGARLRLFTRAPSGDWDEAAYSPLTQRS